MGLSVLGRPNTLLFIPAAALWCWLVQRKTGRAVRAVAAVLLASAVTIAPATFVNYFVGGRWALVTYTGPVNLYIGNAPDATGTYATPPSWHEIVRQEGRPGKEIDWSVFEKAFRPFYCENEGRPAKMIRLMVGLHYLKHAFNPSTSLRAGYEEDVGRLRRYLFVLVRMRLPAGSRGLPEG